MWPPRTTRRLATGLSLVVLGTLVGCNQPLFSRRDPRTQYDRYDRARNQFAPAYQTDEFGRESPNLRGRLEPK